MKKQILAATTAALLSTSASADVLGLYIGGQYWNNEATGLLGENGDLAEFNFEDEINKYFTESEYALGQRMLDMNFLREVVYNTYANNSMVHDSLFDIDSHAQRFSVPMDDYKFIGEIFDENDNRSWEYKKWINLEEK